MADDLTPEWLAGYEYGWRDRTIVALDDADAAWLAVRTEGGRVARALASVPSYAERCDMTGDHARAARQRQILAERGIA